MQVNWSKVFKGKPRNSTGTSLLGGIGMTEAEWLSIADQFSMLEYIRPMATNQQLQSLWNEFVKDEPDLIDAGNPEFFFYGDDRLQGLYQMIATPDDCNIIRDVFGNPFRPFRWYDNQACARCGVLCVENKSKYCKYGGDPDGKNPHKWVLPWITPDVKAIVAGMIEGKCRYCLGRGGWLYNTDELCDQCNGTGKTYDFSDMPILADALEEASCTNEEVINHCRDLERTSDGG